MMGKQLTEATQVHAKGRITKTINDNQKKGQDK